MLTLSINTTGTAKKMASCLSQLISVHKRSSTAATKTQNGTHLLSVRCWVPLWKGWSQRSMLLLFHWTLEYVLSTKVPCQTYIMVSLQLYNQRLLQFGFTSISKLPSAPAHGCLLCCAHVCAAYLNLPHVSTAFLFLPKNFHCSFLSILL